MERWLGRYSEWIYGIARIVIGLLFAAHGAQKLFGGAGGPPQTGSALMTTAGVIELLSGLLIALGVWAGYAAFVASGEMASAYFIAHASGGLSPLANKGELAVVYCFVFLYIASKGSGLLSLDAFVPRVLAGGFNQPHVQRR
jgi:putative oxidoreductase